jgi:hypothetical protein
MIAKEVIAKAVRALPEVLKKWFLYFQKLYDDWHKYVTVLRNHFEGNVHILRVAALP